MLPPDEIAEPAEPAAPNGSGGMKRTGPPVINAPHPRRATDAMIGVEVGGKIESDGSLPLRVAADAVETMRETWRGVCTLHQELLAKTGPLTPEVAQQIRSRRFFFDAKQRSLKSADRALAELRVEEKSLQEKIARATVPPRVREDAGAAVLAGEVRAFLRGLSDADRLATIERAIAADNTVIVGAALEQPALAGLDQTRADLIAGRWRRVKCPDELRRLEVLQQTAQSVITAAERLEQRFAEAYAHGALDALERSQANSNQAA